MWCWKTEQEHVGGSSPAGHHPPERICNPSEVPSVFEREGIYSLCDFWWWWSLPPEVANCEKTVTLLVNTFSKTVGGSVRESVYPRMQCKHINVNHYILNGPTFISWYNGVIEDQSSGCGDANVGFDSMIDMVRATQGLWAVSQDITWSRPCDPPSDLK